MKARRAYKEKKIKRGGYEDEGKREKRKEATEKYSLAM